MSDKKTKNCEHCGNEFELKDLAPGLEQKYCSRSCRMKAGNLRRYETLKRQGYEQAKTETQAVANNDNGRNYEPHVHRRAEPSDSTYFALYDKRVEAEILATKWELKAQELERQNAELKAKIFELEEELNDTDGEAMGNADSGIMGLLSNPAIQMMLASFMKPEKAEK